MGEAPMGENAMDHNKGYEFIGFKADGKLMGHILPGILLFGLSALWFAELMMRRRRNAIGIGRPSAAAAAAHVHMPRASYSSLECLGKLIFPAIGIFTELRSAARYHLPTGILPAFRNHAGEIICEDSGDRECREFSTTLQHWFHITIHLGFMCAAIVELVESSRPPHRRSATKTSMTTRPATVEAKAMTTSAPLIADTCVNNSKEMACEVVVSCPDAAPEVEDDTTTPSDDDDEDDMRAHAKLQGEESSPMRAGRRCTAALLALGGAIMQMSLLFTFHSSMHKNVKGDAIEARAHELLCIPLNVCALAIFCEAVASMFAPIDRIAPAPTDVNGKPLPAKTEGRTQQCRSPWLRHVIRTDLFNTIADWLLFIRAYGMCVSALWLMAIPLHGLLSASLFDKMSAATTMALDMGVFWIFMTVAVACAIVSRVCDMSSCLASSSPSLSLPLSMTTTMRGRDRSSHKKKKTRMVTRMARKLKLDRDKWY